MRAALPPRTSRIPHELTPQGSSWPGEHMPGFLTASIKATLAFTQKVLV